MRLKNQKSKEFNTVSPPSPVSLLESSYISCKEVIAMNSLELTSVITALANAIACKLTLSEISLLASIFVQLGDTLATIATQRSLCEEATKADNE